MTRLVKLLFLVTAACAAQPPPPAARPVEPPAAKPIARPASLDDGLVALGLVRVQVPRTNGGTGLSDRSLHIDGQKISIAETGGWRQSRAVFARRATDNAIVLVREQPHITLQKVQRGCMMFAGGRMWFETGVYELPANERFGGTVIVDYDEVVEDPVYTPTQADGSPCPPPAMD